MGSRYSRRRTDGYPHGSSPDSFSGRPGHKNDIDGLWTAILELKEEICLLTHRFDRLQLTLIAGFMSMIVALIVVGFFG